MVSQADPGVKPAELLSTGAKCKWGGKLLAKAGQGLKKDNVCRAYSHQAVLAQVL